MRVLCTVYSFPPYDGNLCQIGRQFLSVVDNSKVWGKQYGLAECLIFQLNTLKSRQRERTLVSRTGRKSIDKILSSFRPQLARYRCQSLQLE
jgi:hypothetical protein